MTSLYEKRFLNRDGFHSIASIGYSVSSDDYGSLDGEIQINDCSKTIYIDIGDFFASGNATKERENNLRKLEILISVLENCKRDFLIISEECDVITEKNKAKKELETKKKKSIFDIFRRNRNARN